MSKLKLFMSAAAACFAASAPAWAQQTQAPAQQPNHAATPAANDEVVVTGAHSDETRIDRHVYSVRNDPIAQTSSTIDILSRLPGVAVSPSGAIRLLGSTPMIQIDGQPVSSSSLQTVLRTMTGDQIERIEVMTNPSAQYSAQATGGIINIVTRRSFGRGLTGSVTANVDTMGSGGLTLSPNWTRGAFTFSGRLGYNHSHSKAFGFVERDFIATPEIITEIGDISSHNDNENGQVLFVYRPDNRHRASASYERSEGDSVSYRDLADVSTLVGPLFSEHQSSPSNFHSEKAAFTYDWSGAHSGESLSLNGTFSHWISSAHAVTLVMPSSGPSTAFDAPTHFSYDTPSLKLDYQRPFGPRLFTAGLAFDQAIIDSTTAFVTLNGPPGPADFFNELKGAQSTAAAYLTYQFPIGRWTFLPGARVEDFIQDAHSIGPVGRQNDTRLFPTIHMRRTLRPNLTFDVSYSRRISHPQLSQIDPALRFLDATHAIAGNPDLRPNMTDAYEVALTYQTNRMNYNVTLYDRITDSTFSSIFVLRPDGVQVSTLSNAGSAELRGAQFTISQPLGPLWRLTANANLQDHIFNRLSGSVVTRASEFEYSGGAQLEYRDLDQNRIGATDVQIGVQFQSPFHALAATYDQSLTASFAWRRKITDKAAAQLSISDVFDGARGRSTTLSNATIDHTLTRNEGGAGGDRRVLLTLTYQLGAPAH